MKPWKIVLGVIGFFVALIIIGFVSGYTDVLYTKIIGKAKKNAETEVFYETQQYVRSMTLDAQKYYREYQSLGTDAERRGYKQIVSQHFADFDEEKHLKGEVLKFIQDCKYN